MNKILPLLRWWHRGVAVGVGLAIKKSWVRVSAGRHGVKTLGKFLTPMCLCHQAVQVGTGPRAVMPDGWEGKCGPGGK